MRTAVFRADRGPCSFTICGPAARICRAVAMAPDPVVHRSVVLLDESARLPRSNCSHRRRLNYIGPYARSRIVRTVSDKHTGFLSALSHAAERALPVDSGAEQHDVVSLSLSDVG